MAAKHRTGETSSAATRAPRSETSRLGRFAFDFNPFEPGWALLKKRVIATAPRTATHLGCSARRARRFVQPHHGGNPAAPVGHQLKGPLVQEEV